MSTNTLSKETELRLTDFFNKTVDPISMAKTIRHLNYLVTLSVMRENETFKLDMTNLENGFYWLNQLAEVLNPYLDIE